MLINYNWSNYVYSWYDENWEVLYYDKWVWYSRADIWFFESKRYFTLRHHSIKGIEEFRNKYINITSYLIDKWILIKNE